MRAAEGGGRGDKNTTFIYKWNGCAQTVAKQFDVERLSQRLIVAVAWCGNVNASYLLHANIYRHGPFLAVNRSRAYFKFGAKRKLRTRLVVVCCVYAFSLACRTRSEWCWHHRHTILPPRFSLFFVRFLYECAKRNWLMWCGVIAVSRIHSSTPFLISKKKSQTNFVPRNCKIVFVVDFYFFETGGPKWGHIKWKASAVCSQSENILLSTFFSKIYLLTENGSTKKNVMESCVRQCAARWWEKKWNICPLEKTLIMPWLGYVGVVRNTHRKRQRHKFPFTRHNNAKLVWCEGERNFQATMNHPHHHSHRPQSFRRNNTSIMNWPHQNWSFSK